MIRRLLLAVAIAMLSARIALAQLPDPTRPADLAPEGAATGLEAPGGGLQAIIIRPAGKSAALIDGRYVRLGGRVGERRLLEISETEIVLGGESGREVIRLLGTLASSPANRQAQASALSIPTRPGKEQANERKIWRIKRRPLAEFLGSRHSCAGCNRLRQSSIASFRAGSRRDQ